MKSLINCILICLALSCKPAAPDLTIEKQAIHTVVKAQEAAWNSGDLAGFMQGYWHHDSMQFISSRGITRGWDSTLASYRKHYPGKDKMGTLTFRLQQIRFIDTPGLIAQVSGKWTLHYPADSVGGYFSLITKKFGGHHKIIIDHTW